MNKKATLIANWPVFLVATAILAVILIIFFILISAGGNPKEESIASSSVLNDADNILTTYLKSRVTIDNKDISIQELISLYYFNKNKYQGILETTTKEILNKATYQFYHPSSNKKMIRTYSLVLYDKKASPSFILKIEADKFKIAYYPKLPLAATYVPISEKESLYVGLWEGESRL